MSDVIICVFLSARLYKNYIFPKSTRWLWSVNNIPFQRNFLADNGPKTVQLDQWPHEWTDLNVEDDYNAYDCFEHIDTIVRQQH